MKSPSYVITRLNGIPQRTCRGRAFNRPGIVTYRVFDGCRSIKTIAEEFGGPRDTCFNLYGLNKCP